MSIKIRLIFEKSLSNKKIHPKFWVNASNFNEIILAVEWL